MQSDSDTESEHEYPRCRDNIINGPASNSFISPGANPEKNTELGRGQVEDALSAVAQIKSVDLITICDDIDTQDLLHNAYNDIADFLDDACVLPLRGHHFAKVITVFTHVGMGQALFTRYIRLNDVAADASFLSTLFSHRQAFQHTPQKLTTIFWLDVILAKLGLFVSIIAGGFSPKLQAPFLQYMRLHRNEDVIQVSAQLPERWQSIINVIGSNNTSPATKRLALRLMFAAYVMSPQLTGRDPWTDRGVQPEPLMVSLIRSSNSRTLNGLAIASLRPYDAQECTDYAMTVSLFSICHAVQSKSDANAPSLLLRPQSLSHILDMIQAVMYQPSASFSWLSAQYPDLDLAQTILVRWGNLVPWAWSVWDDQRFAGLECITDLTITWLYHTHLPVFSVDICRGTTNQFETLIAGEEASSWMMAILVLLEITAQLRDTFNSEAVATLSPALTLVLCKACWATVHLLRQNMEQVQPRVIDFCRCLLSLFCILGEAKGELKIKTLVLEALTMIAPRTLAVCLVQMNSDGLNYMDEGIVRSENALCTSAILPCSVLAVKCLLDFLTILWHSRAEKSVCRATSSAFFRSTVAVLKNQGPNSYASLILRNTLLIAISAFGSSHTLDDIKPIQEWLLQTSLVHSGCSDFIAASGISQCILASRCNALQYAEAWSYLRDVLLLILGRHFAEENEALALLISPTICLALAEVAGVNWPGLHFLLSSPWTMSLCTELRSLLEPRQQPVVPYFITLRRRLSLVGTILLNKFTSPRPLGIIDAAESRNSESNLVFCAVYPCSRLVLITEA